MLSRTLWKYAAALIAAMALAGGVHAKGGKDKGQKQYLQAQNYANAQPAAQGTVKQMLIDQFGEVNGLLLDTNTIITFPAHMSEQLTALIKPGSTVTVKGYPERPNQVKGYVIIDSGSNQTLMVQSKPPKGMNKPKHLRGPALKEMSAQGVIQHVLYGKKGEARSVILADGSIVYLPKRGAYEFAHLLRAGQTLAAKGYGTENTYGRAIEATSIGANQQSLQPIWRK